MKNNIQELPIRSLKLNELNAKKHPREQVLAIAKSIRRYGFVAPIIVDSKYRVLAGHGRIQAATEIGLDSVPAIIADHLSEELGNEYTLIDNRLAELAEYDNDLLADAIANASSEFIETFSHAFEEFLTGEQNLIDQDTEIGQDQTTERSKRANQQGQQDSARDNEAKIPIYILVPLGPDTNRRLKSYARQHDTTAGEAAAELIAQALAVPQGAE